MASPTQKKGGKSKPTEGAPLKIAGRFVNEVMQSASTTLSLVTTVGEGESGAFVVPFTYLSILEAATEGEPNEVFAAFLTLDNTAYLLADLAGELSTAVERLTDCGSPALPVEPTRLNAMRDYAAAARRALDELDGHLAQFKGAS